MKVAKQSGGEIQYQLSQKEAHCLRLVIRQFPIGAFLPATISKVGSGMAEREKLLNESLAAHRDELKKKARALVAEDKFKTAEGHLYFHINRESRETMLQVLNEVRMECWRILGQPQNLEINLSRLPREKIRYYQFMEFAGFFECCFLDLEDEEGNNPDSKVSS